MDPTTASYYRAILYVDRESTDPLPESLICIHDFAFKRHQALGLGSLISKQAALSVALTWLSSTTEGKEFSRKHTSLGELFGKAPTPAEREKEIEEKVDWSKVKVNTPVIVSDDGMTINGTFFARAKNKMLEVVVGNEKKSFRAFQVQLASEAVPVGTGA